MVFCLCMTACDYDGLLVLSWTFHLLHHKLEMMSETRPVTFTVVIGFPLFFFLHVSHKLCGHACVHFSCFFCDVCHLDMCFSVSFAGVVTTTLLFFPRRTDGQMDLPLEAHQDVTWRHYVKEVEQEAPPPTPQFWNRSIVGKTSVLDLGIPLDSYRVWCRK